MKLLSVNVGGPRMLNVGDRRILSSIYKSPVAGRVAVGRRNLAGDQQSDLRVHGGAKKAVYVYPSEHYAFWSRELGVGDLPFGAFGENLTTAGLLEHAVRIGARLRIGSAEFEITQPREPCFKLAAKFNRPDMIRRFLDSERSGFYLRVAQEGEIESGDAIAYFENDPNSRTVIDVLRTQAADRERE